MDILVKTRDSQGNIGSYLYDRASTPLGAGATGVVYKGRERDTGREVAIKVSRSTSDADIEREMKILERLYDPDKPGGDAVLWAVAGQEDGVTMGVACMVMDLVGDENQLSSRMAQLGTTKLGDADILEKELLATRTGRQYAQLLVRMAEKGVISRGDRKATDFRLMGGKNSERLVVLDWNRAEIIDTEALKKHSDEYIRRRENDLRSGAIADIQIFAHWWAEFALGKKFQGKLSDIGDGDRPGWVDLTDGFRDILLRAEATGTMRGYDSAEELLEALTRHEKWLSVSSLDQLSRELESLERDKPPAWQRDMMALVDLGRRRRLSDVALSRFRTLAESGAENAASIAKDAEKTLKDMYFGRDGWEGGKNFISDTLHRLGGVTPETASAHLILWRLDVIADAMIKNDVRGKNKQPLWQLMDAMERLSQVTGSLTNARSALDSIAKGDDLRPLKLELDLRPLELELDLRAAFGLDQKVEIYRNLRDIRREYADALRMSLPDLDRQVRDLDQDGQAKASLASLDTHLKDTREALWERFFNDIDSKSLPPADRAAAIELRRGPSPADRATAIKLRREPYRDLWQKYYDARHARWAAETPSDKHKGADAIMEWFDAVLESMLRLRADEAARLLENPPEGVVPSKLPEYREKCFTRWAELLEEGEHRGDARWPDDVDRAVALAGMLQSRGKISEELLAKLNDTQEKQEDLRRRLGVEKYQGDSGTNNWAGFREHVTTDNASDIEAALSESVSARLEVWQPSAIVEGGFDATDLEQILEGYRARTLLALRSAKLLSSRARQYSDELTALASDIDKGRRENFVQIEKSLGDADAYAAHLSWLKEMAETMAGQQKEYEELQRTGHGLQDNLRTQIGILKQTTDNLTTVLNNKSTDPYKAIAAAAPLAQVWLVTALDRAGRLDLDGAETLVETAKQILSENAPLAIEVNAIADAIEQIRDIAKENPKLWGQLQSVQAAMSQGNKEEAAAAWKGVTTSVSDWGSNRVWWRLDQRIFDMPATSAASTTVEEPGQDEVDSSTPPTTDEEMPTGGSDFSLQDSIDQWRRISPYEALTSEQVRSLVKSTDRTLHAGSLDRLNREHLKTLLEEVERVVKIGKAKQSDANYLDENDNYGHLYALKYRIETIRDNPRG